MSDPGELSKGIRPLGLDPAAEAKFYGSRATDASEATFTPTLLSDPIRNSATSSGYGVKSPEKNNGGDGSAKEDSRGDTAFVQVSPFKSPFRDIKTEPREPFVVEAMPVQAKFIKCEQLQSEPTFVPKLESNQSARDAASSSGYGRVAIEIKENSAAPRESFSPSMDETKKARKLATSSGYGKVAIQAKKKGRTASPRVLVQTEHGRVEEVSVLQAGRVLWLRKGGAREIEV